MKGGFIPSFIYLRFLNIKKHYILKKKSALLLTLIAFTSIGYAQLIPSTAGQIHGNVQVLMQQYNEDSLIGASVPPEKFGLNAYGNIIYTKDNFSAGIRYESYLPAINGFPGRFKGSGIGYRFARYQHQKFDITIGNFYEQFGSGMTFRSYEERNLGIDNAMDGFRLIYRPINGITIKGIVGKHRLDFESGLINSEEIIRAVDGEININEVFNEKLGEKKTKITLGGSFVSKFQKGDLLEKESLFLTIPQNVALGSGRLGIIRGGVTFFGEYVNKINDPSFDNGYIYKNGEALLLQTGYSKKGFGVNVSAKMVDNMSYRSNRDLVLLDGPINFLPTITKQHTYNLAATLYPYATVINGETGLMIDLFYKIKKKTRLGGKYGTLVSLNYAAVNNLDTTNLQGLDGIVYGYERNSLMPGNEKFVRDLNIEISRKINKKLKLKYTFFDLEFNTLVTAVTNDFKGIVYADIHVLEVGYKIKSKHSIRTEFQLLTTNQDKKDWATVVAEYNWSPHWFVSILDQYNYGNDDSTKKIHYLFGTFGYINGSNRISVGYGKRREGIFCVGGICRSVPASNGLEITLTSSF